MEKGGPPRPPFIVSGPEERLAESDGKISLRQRGFLLDNHKI
jgi:hypothetical protein